MENAMAENDQEKATLRLAGYAALINLYGLEVIPNWHRSLVTTSGIHRINSTGNVIEEVYPPKYWPGNTLGDHLEFALKYDGMNLAILAGLFQAVTPEDFQGYVRSKPTGKYTRQLWFLYEFLTGTILRIDDVKQGNYIDLLDPDEYYTVTPARQVRRQRINDNLPGDRRFCPTIRRTDILKDFEESDLPEQCRKVVSGYSPELLKRALSYLYSNRNEIILRDRTHQAQPKPNRALRRIASDGGARRLLRKSKINRPSESHCRSAILRIRLPIEPELCR